MQDEQFEIVVVCTGNRARSPVAEAFLRHLLADLPVTVRSLGTLDLGPVAALPEAVESAAAHGLDLSSHCARTLRGEDLSQADLVLGFERSHVASAAVDCGAPRERVFTMGELVSLLEEVELDQWAAPVERARRAITAAAAVRGRETGGMAELADPIGGSASVYRHTVFAVRELSIRLAQQLFGEGALRPLPDGATAPREHGRRGRRRGRLAGRAEHEP